MLGDVPIVRDEAELEDIAYGSAYTNLTCKTMEPTFRGSFRIRVVEETSVGPRVSTE